MAKKEYDPLEKVHYLNKKGAVGTCTREFFLKYEDSSFKLREIEESDTILVANREGRKKGYVLKTKIPEGFSFENTKIIPKLGPDPIVDRVYVPDQAVIDAAVAKALASAKPDQSIIDAAVAKAVTEALEKATGPSTDVSGEGKKK